MSKYDPLRDHLMLHGERELEMTFREIEKVLGSTLPPSAGLPHWWATAKRISPPQRKAWGAAGYVALLLMGTRTVRFRKVNAR